MLSQVGVQERVAGQGVCYLLTVALVLGKGEYAPVLGVEDGGPGGLVKVGEYQVNAIARGGGAEIAAECQGTVACLEQPGCLSQCAPGTCALGLCRPPVRPEPDGAMWLRMDSSAR